MIAVSAYAKINLALEVLNKREDGYHEIASIMQTVDLSDILAFEAADTITLDCDVVELRTKDNLALKAAELLKAETGYSGGAHVVLSKGIPVSAGLGGGSSDAAATLKGLNTMWELGLSIEELTPLAARLGSDVPFFLHGGTAMVHGRGEKVRPMPPADLEWVIILAPAISVPRKTAALYSKLTGSDHTKGALTRKLEARIRGGSHVPPQFLFNAFDDVALDTYPGLRQYWDTLHSLGAREIHIAGSGPALYAPVSRKEVGTAIQALLQHRYGWEAHLVRTQARDEPTQ